MAAGQALVSGAAQTVGSNVATAILSTPPGQAAMASTVAVAVAAAPVVAAVATTGAIVYGIAKVMEALDL